MKFENLKISQRLLLVNIAVVLTLTLSALWQQNTLKRAYEAAASNFDRIQSIIVLSTKWEGLSHTNMQRVLAVTLSDEPVIHKTFNAEISKVIAEIGKLQTQLKELATQPEDMEALRDLDVSRKRVTDAVAQARDLKAQDKSAEALRIVEKEIQPNLDGYLRKLAQFVKLQEQHLADALTEAEVKEQRAELIAWLLMGLVAAMSLSVCMLIARSITRPLQDAIALSSSIAQGDLTQDTHHTERKDEIGELMRESAAMQSHLHAVVADVRTGVNSVAVAAKEISDGGSDLSARTEGAAASLEETAASMEQMASTVAMSSDSAIQASTLANTARSEADSGQAIVTQVKTQMMSISESANRIADIVGTVESIAFQTNILALNAAVEAARAGTQGRGFAVVASEVRALATRSSEAAKEIKVLIENSMQQVQAGLKLANQTGDTMEAIVAGIAKATNAMGEVAAAAQEQSGGISQVNIAVGQLDHMTQANAALVEESLAAAQSLRDQADRLATIMNGFKTEQR